MSSYCIYEMSSDYYEHQCELKYDSCEDCPYRYSQEDYEDDKADLMRE